MLTEEERLLAAYYTQVLANNQTKSRLLSSFTAHKLINPASLHTLTSRLQADEVTVRTYLEYEEKHAVGSEKDRVRRQQKCHVNYCRCHACFNAHLVVEEEDSSEEVEVERDELRDREVDVDDSGEALDGSQLDVEEDEGDGRVDDQRSATSVVSVSRTSVTPLCSSSHPHFVR